ncbi:MAG TPA: glycoside hydrolase family 66 protein [Candidatus Nanopelagicaceae bacterium]|nr:glycoside hydrolase family 66 protein [Candidatus Nanopelagicaceae bacterium]
MSEISNVDKVGRGRLHILDDVRCFYRIGEEIALSNLPVGTTRVLARSSVRNAVEAEVGDGAQFPQLPAGTYAIEALDADGRLLAEELTTVGSHPGERPVHGFATSFRDEDINGVLAWNRSLRSTVVQVYDWMESYTEPLGATSGWKDPSNRTVSFEGLRALASGLKDLGAVTHAYAPVYAVGNAFAAEHPEMLMYSADGQAIRFLDQIVLANPGNVDWQRHFVAAYGAAADAVGFDGFHVDTYGYPRIAQDANGHAIDLRVAYESFLDFLRVARPTDLISFNQVNGVPSAARICAEPSFRYCEIWPPNSEWRHFEGLLDRSSGISGLIDPSTRESLMRGSLACYPPVWGVSDSTSAIEGPAREASLRTDVATEAIVTLLGASSLIFGDQTAVLCDPYYPKRVHLTEAEADTVLSWHRFGLRCRDLFLEGEDTSWYDIGDENGSVAVESSVPVRPEPLGETIFARVVHAEGLITVGVVDLTGSPNGSWSEPTEKGNVSSVTVRVLVDDPLHWRVEAAVLGASDERFSQILSSDVPHRQGRALEVELPLVGGWSVLRFKDERTK